MLNIDRKTFSNKNYRIRLLGLIGLSILSLGFANPSAAATFTSCSGTNPDYDISGFVNPSSDCTILNPLNGNDNDSPQPGFVNDNGFFEITNWLFDGKFNDIGKDVEADNSSLFTFEGDTLSGTFTKTLAALWDEVEKVMLVFKDGANTNLVGYLINLAALADEPFNGEGNYESPFTNPPFNVANTRDISHISVYYTKGEGSTTPGGDPIPEPSTILLMGFGLLGFGTSQLRKRHKTQPNH